MKTPFFMAACSLLVVLAVAQPSQAADVTVYAVSSTADGGLNMRSAPGTNSSVIVRIPANGTGIVATGEEKKVGNTVWAKVYWAGKGGWVSKTYLSSNTNLPTSNKPAPTKPPSSGGISMKCGGTEPFWDITLTEGQVRVNMLDGPKYSVPVTFRQTSANNQTIAVIAGGSGANETQTFLQKVAECSDGMSDKNYPYAVTAVVNRQKVVSGCCDVQR
jgi:uncharacterized membrane protein